MTHDEATLIMTFAKCDMSFTRTAKVMYVDPTTVRYRLEKFQQKTGWNPMDFFDLCYLIGVLKNIKGENDAGIEIQNQKRKD